MSDRGPQGSQVNVEVELLFLSEDAGALAYRLARRPVEDRIDPDAVALAGAGPAPAVVHSTSWRYEPDGGLVLTYVVAPDPSPAAASPLDTTLVVSSGDPLRPRPAQLHAHHVAAHAVRHVADLAATDPALVEVVSADPALWEAIARAASSLRTGTHEEPHAAPGDVRSA